MTFRGVPIAIRSIAPMSPLSSTGRTPSPEWRHAYVERQLATASYALHLGSIGAARAALRVLSSEDFAAPAEASRHLRTVRSHGAEMEDIVQAMRHLCALTAGA
jgi:hypothetical protein